MKMIKLVLSILMALMLVGTTFGGGCAKKTPTDSLTVGWSGLGSETFLPWNASSAQMPYMLLINEPWTYFDPETNELIPGLVTKWEMSPDGKTWTFSIRKGVQFHEDWGELTAEDFKYTLERIMAPESVCPQAGSLRRLIQKMEVPDPYTLVIYLNAPQISLVTAYFNDSSLGGIIVCKKYVETVGDENADAHPIGTGPYTLAEKHQKGGPIKLVTIPDVDKHWRVTPEFKTITFLCVPEEATRVAMLKTGEVDLAPISYDSIDTIEASGLHIISLPKIWTPYIRLGGLVSTDPKRCEPSNPWFKKEVRQALNYAIDKEAICKHILKGEAVPAGAVCASPAWLDIPPYPYDPAKAKQLLAAAGYPNGFPITLKTCTMTPGAELPMIGETVAMYWKAIGIDVKIEPTDFGAIRSDVDGFKANDYAFTFRDPLQVDSVKPVILSFNVANPPCFYGTPESVDKVEKVSQELDITKRANLIKEIGLFFREEGVAVFLAFANEAYGASKKVGKWPAGPKASNIDMITHP